MPDAKPTTAASPTPTPSAPSSSSAQSAPAGAVVAASDERGTTTIAEVVVSKIAGIATREVGGVHEVGGGAARMVGAIRDLIPGGQPAVTQGVHVEVTGDRAAVAVSFTADYGVAINELAEAVRLNIIHSVEGMTGLEVSRVDVDVTDVYLPGQDDVDPHAAGSGTRTP